MKTPKEYCGLCGYDIGKKDSKATDPEICCICEDNLKYGLTPNDIKMIVDRSKNRKVEAWLAKTKERERERRAC